MSKSRQSKSGAAENDGLSNLPASEANSPILLRTTYPKGCDDPISRMLYDEFVLHHTRFCEALRATVSSAIAAGGALHSLKARTDQGSFGHIRDHVAKEFGISERTAQRYMFLYRNRQRLAEILREQCAPQAEGLSDEKLLEQITLNQAMRLLAAPDSTDSTNDKSSATRRSAWQNCRVPIAICGCVQSFWDHGSWFLSEADESNTLNCDNFVVGRGVLRDSYELAGRVFVNAIRPELPKALLGSVCDAFDRGVIQEGLLLLPNNHKTTGIRTLARRGRIVFRELLVSTTPVPDKDIIEQAVFPVPAMIIALCTDERFSLIAHTFESIADAYLPLTMN